jgi:hypothetical protein
MGNSTGAPSATSICLTASAMTTRTVDGVKRAEVLHKHHLACHDGKRLHLIVVAHRPVSHLHLVNRPGGCQTGAPLCVSGNAAALLLTTITFSGSKQRFAPAMSLLSGLGKYPPVFSWITQSTLSPSQLPTVAQQLGSVLRLPLSPSTTFVSRKLVPSSNA